LSEHQSRLMIREEIFSDAKASEFVDFSKIVYEESSLVTNLELVRNKHLRNPDGKSLLYQILENDVVTGRLAVVYRKGANRSSNDILRNPVDLVSIGKHPFGGINLYRASLKIKDTDNGGGVFHTSNPKSEVFYRKILKEVPVAELSYRAIPLSMPENNLYLNFVNHILFFSRNLITTLLGLGGWFSRIQILLVEDFENDQIETLMSWVKDIVLQRDSERIAWRFPNCDKSAQYKKIELYKNDKFQGYLVLRNIQSQGLSAIAVVDFYFTNLTLFDRCKIYQELMKCTQNENVIFVIANFKNRKIQKMFRFPFIRVPKKFVPQEFPVYSPLSNRVNSINEYSYLTLFDLDVM
jgi:hypothetical protein